MKEEKLIDIKSAISSIESDVKSLEKQKEDIQTECLHKEGFDINFDEKKNIKKFCAVCKTELGYAPKEDCDKFLGKKGNNV